MCGKRGDPLPPLVFYPKKVEFLSAEQVEDKLLVKWKPVERFYDGRVIEDKENLYYEIFVDFGKRKYRTKKTFFLDEEPFEVGERRCYTVYAIYKEERSKPSEPFCITTKEPIKEVPTVLDYFGGDGFVKFVFSPGERYSIEIFRNGKLYEVLPEGEKKFIDVQVVNSVEYKYRFRFSQGSLKGGFTKIFRVVPQDKIPPKPPKNPFLVRKGKSCIFLWEPSPSNDVVEYLILNNNYVLGSIRKGIYFFLKNCEKEATYYIRAVDKAGNLSRKIKVKEELNEKSSSSNGK
jgi:hypothetical protein